MATASSDLLRESKQTASCNAAIPCNSLCKNAQSVVSSMSLYVSPTINPCLLLLGKKNQRKPIKQNIQIQKIRPFINYFHKRTLYSSLERTLYSIGPITSLTWPAEQKQIDVQSHIDAWKLPEMASRPLRLWMPLEPLLIGLCPSNPPRSS